MLNHAIEALAVYASKSIARRVEGDARIISLSIGEPEFGPPPGVSERLEELVRSGSLFRELKHYEASLGARALRDAISGYYRGYFDLDVRADDQILVTHGGAGALSAAVLASSRPGDEILIADPSYQLYERMIIVLGRVPGRISRFARDGYRYDLQRVREAIHPNTAMMIVNSPENPTGYVCSDEEMSALVGICAEHGMMLLHDEVYDQFDFHRTHRPAGRLAGFANVIQVNSMSKKFGLPGLRVGWVVSNASTVAVATKAQEYTTLAINSFGERIAEACLGCPGVQTWFGETRDMLQGRVTRVTERLGMIDGIEFPSRIAGAMFAFPTVSVLAERLQLPRAATPGEAVATWLLETVGVAVVPGAVYGHQGDDSIRIVLCGPGAELERALDRISAASSIPHLR